MHDQQLDEKAIFSAALSLASVEARHDYLKQVCGDYPAIFRRVSKLLQVEAEPTSFLEAPAAGILETLGLPSHATRIGMSIDRYKLRELLGEGGMGSVYVAEQEEPVRRKVALKLIKPGMDSREVVSRFEAERQALTMMDHPNIAKVLDAGTTDRGRPYFAMELVRGLPITEHCDAHKLTTRDRLELFLQVCRAVQHAHQKAVIHRDLKPSNVIVAMHDATPVVKVIDFGVAKALGSKLTDHTLYTGFNQLVGTPLYMSPEQAGQSNLDIDTRSDIYSLGVLLYELLTGCTPFDSSTLKEAGYDEMRRIIREIDPPRPSDRVSTMNAANLSTTAERRHVEPKHFSRLIRGELDWIVMKALDKDRNRRYQSASALAADVQRYIDNEPVEACPPSISYRLRKFSRRYRAQLATASTLVVMMLVATAISTLSALKANRALQNESLALASVVEKQSLLESEKSESEARRLKAEQLESEAVVQRETARSNLYLSDMRLAAIDLGKRNMPRLTKKLNDHIPDSSSTDFRRWEWYYLQATSQQEQRTLFGNTAQVEDVAWSPDGKYVASTGFEGVRIWDLATGLQVYENSSGIIHSRGTAWSPDSQRLAWGSIGEDGFVRIWDSRTNDVVKLAGHTFSLLSVCWSPDGRRVASSAMDGTCRVWDLEKRQAAFVLEYEKVYFPDVSWNSKKDLLVTACNLAEKGAVIWNPKTGEHITDVLVGQATQAVEFSLDGHRLIVGTGTGRCIVLDTDNWNKLIEFEAHSGSIKSIAVNPDQTTFATCGGDRAIRVWSLADGHLISTLNGHTSSVNSVAWSPSGEELVSGSTDARVKIWNIQQSSTFRQHTIDFAKPTTIQWQPSSSLLYFTSENGTTGLVDTQSGRVEQSAARSWWSSQGNLPTQFDVVANLSQAEQEDRVKPTQLDNHPTIENGLKEFRFSWTSDGTHMALFRAIVAPVIPGLPGTERRIQIEIWDSLAKESRIQWNIGKVQSAQWAPDNRRLAVAGSGQRVDGGSLLLAGWVYVFDADSGKMLHKMQHGTERSLATAIAWNPTGTRLISGNQSGLVCLWDANTGDLLRTEDMQGLGILSLAWSPDQHRIALASKVGHVKIVDAETCEELLVLQEDGHPVNQLAWSLDGRQLSGIDSEGVIVVWDAIRGYEFMSSTDVLRNQQYEDLGEAKQLVQAKKYDVAMRLLDDLASQGFDDLVAINRLRAEVYLAREDDELALAAHTQIVELSPTSTSIWAKKAQGELRLGRLAEAIDSCTIAIELGPMNHWLYVAYCTRGDAYQRLGKYDLGQADLQQALNVPLVSSGMADRLMAWNLLSNRERTQRDVEQALKHAEQAIQIDPEFFKNWNMLALAHYYSGQWQAAIDAIQKSMSLYESETSYDLFFLAMAHWQLNQKTEALQRFDQATKWMEDNEPQDKVLLRFRDDAAELLGL